MPSLPIKSLREFVRDTLLDRIARGDLPPGQRVVEATLVEEFTISATPVREAMRELVAMGVLEAQNHKGASVRQIRLQETIEAFQVRTRFTMDYLQSADPVAIAREHIPIVDAPDSGHAELVAALLASHSNYLVEFLGNEPPLRRDVPALSLEGAAR
jgi:DNA-binding GntR family transcriptional regulator